jgi:hypothetical protein
MFSSNPFSAGDPLGGEKPKQVPPGNVVRFQRVFLLCVPSGDPGLDPDFQPTLVSLFGSGLPLNNFFFSANRTCLARFGNACVPATGRFLPKFTRGIRKLDPPVRRVGPLVQTGHSENVTNVAKYATKSNSYRENKREKNRILQRNNYSWFKSMRGSTDFNRVKSDYKRERNSKRNQNPPDWRSK